jgi:hypothetical protein
MPSAVGWEPGDDICPPWWPRWWPRRPWPRPPRGFDKLEQVHLTLALHEIAGQLKDKRLAGQIQKLTDAALKVQVNGLR